MCYCNLEKIGDERNALSCGDQIAQEKKSNDRRRGSQSGDEETSLPAGNCMAAADAAGVTKADIEKGRDFKRERLLVWRWRSRTVRRRDIGAENRSDRREKKKQENNGDLLCM
uniref:Uncharacterized protein n=1 Tax=Noccaea caerulescens TaxID=107243 RepID=A0A1J3K7W7_NOCCA